MIFTSLFRTGTIRTRLDEVFNRLKKMLDTVESIEGIEFARSNQYGYITSCPSNLGTGMRASVHIKVPKLTSDGQTDPHGNSPTWKFDLLDHKVLSFLISMSIFQDFVIRDMHVDLNIFERHM